jgi:hypothetical protein
MKTILCYEIPTLWALRPVLQHPYCTTNSAARSDTLYYGKLKDDSDGP